MRDQRPHITPALEAIVADVAAKEFPGIDANDLLVVGLGAHATAAASIRSLDGVCKSASIGGSRRRIELGLRPPFFLDGDAPRRLATIVHELLHLDPAKRGALHEARRHAHRSHAEHEAEARAIARRWLARDRAAEKILCLAHHGEVLLRQWKHRPSESTARRSFDDDDVFEAPIVVVTAKNSRGGWW